MGQSLYKIAEQVSIILEKRVSTQVLIPACIDAYGYIAKQQWYESVAQDSQEIDGSFLNVFSNLTPILDLDRDLYYIILPSTYLILPHEMGIAWVSHMKERKSWVRVQNWGMFAGLKASLLGGRQVYEIEGIRMWFPKMTKEISDCPILLKLAIAYDTIDPYEEINIGPNIINDIINIVTKPYMVKYNPIEKIREIIN
jgi:hypothetical protein